MDWWLFREWGPPVAGGWLEWPAREFSHARGARNVYLALTGYRDASDVVEWCNANPQAWGIVSSVMAIKAQHGA